MMERAQVALKRRVIYSVILFAAYFATAWLGLNLDAVSGFASYIWLPTGIAIAALLLWGMELWVGIFAAAFLVNLVMGAPLPAAAAIGVGNTLESIAAVFLLRYLGFTNSFSHLRDTLSFVLACIVSPLISASIGVFALNMAGVVPAQELMAAWVAWVVGDTVGAIVIAPLLLVWLRELDRPESTWESLEQIASWALVGIVTYVIFWTGFARELLPFPYPVLIPMAWVAVRTGLRGTTIATFILASVAIGGVLAGNGVLSNVSEVTHGLFVTQLFVATFAVIFLAFSSVVEERHETYGSLRDYVEKLEHALRRIRGEDKAKTEFIAVLAHELRNPLAPVLSTLEMMKLEHAGDQKTLESVKSMHRHIGSMGRLLDDLLDIARISRKKYKLERVAVHLQAVVQQSVETVDELFKARDHSLVLSVPQEDIWFEADPIRIEQIIVNLLNNAAKYTERGGTIRLTCRAQNDELTICVEDNGIGLAPDTLKRIFEPFLQAIDGKSGSAGLGIGLSLTKRLVELHGGTIFASSRGLGHGSSFTVTLPAPSRLTLPMNKTAEVPVQKRLVASKLRVLVIDDNKAAAHGLAKLLGYHGHETEVGYAGTDALRLVRASSPDVVVLDIGLPDMSGHDVAREIVNTIDNPPLLIAVTGFGQDEDKIKSKNAGFSHHLTKPIGISDLIKILDKIPRNTPGKNFADHDAQFAPSL